MTARQNCPPNIPEPPVRASAEKAAKIAVGMGAHVTIIDNNLDRLRELDDIFLSKIATLASLCSEAGEQRLYGSGFERHRFEGRRQYLRR